MRAATVLLATLAFSAVKPTTAQTQPQESSENGTPGHQFVLHIDFLAPSVSYARFVGDNWLVGGGAGIGFSVLSLSAIGGPHFSEGSMIEFVPAFLFVRYQSTGSFQVDMGLRASAMAHAAFGDFGEATFLGAYVAPFVGGRKFKVGLRVVVGRFSETQIPAQIGVNVSPTLRLVF